MDVKVSGLKEVMDRFKHFYDEPTKEAVANTVETYARKMANDSAAMAPIKHGYLRGSIASSPEKVEPMLWTYGSNLSYARRQEYEHRTHKGFIRRSIWTNREAFRAALKKRIIEGE